MGWEADAGHNLAVKDQAAENVGKGLDQLAEALEKVQAKFRVAKSNLGMNGSKEGDTWNGKVDDANQAVYDRIGQFIDAAKALANSAHTMQTQCHNIEDSAADQFNKLDRSAGYPPKP